MQAGKRRGAKADMAGLHAAPVGAKPARRSTLDPLGLFYGDDGYSSLFVAVALLTSLALVFALGQATWTLSKSARIQTVADAAALSGMQPVKSFAAVAQVVDATVLSLGLTGFMVLGVGSVVALIPGLGGAGVEVARAGHKILDARKSFAESGARGLKTLEQTLPALVAAHSFSVVEAYDTDVDYSGVALAYPLEGQSDFMLADDVDISNFNELTQQMADASDALASYEKTARDARERAWRADCVDEPMCAASRAESLAGLSGTQNPRYTQPEGWSFGVALKRGRAYYAARLAREAPRGDSVDEQANSAMRREFYRYALELLNAGYYRETGGSVSMKLPELPRNKATTKASELYARELWPASLEAEGVVIHAYEACPAALGESLGLRSLASLDAGATIRCDVCELDLSALGQVASASTNINNGFEYYWAIIVEEASRYQEAREQIEAAEGASQELAGQTLEVFTQALEALKIPRPKLKPPGYRGCIAVVIRGHEAVAPEQLSSAFASQATLPRGVALAGATLAPDENTSSNTVLTRFLDTVTSGAPDGVAGILGGVTSAWADLLLGYGSAYEGASSLWQKLTGTLERLGASSVASWLNSSMSALMGALGIEPADMRYKKPVLCATQDILSSDDTLLAQKIRSKILELPGKGSAQEIIAALGQEIKDELLDRPITLGQLEIPGTTIKIDLTIKLKDLVRIS